MYTYDKTITLVTCASPVQNNLALLDVDEYLSAEALAVIHEGYINVIPIRNPEQRCKYVPLFNGKRRGEGFVKQV